MKKRIIAFVLVVVMAAMALVSCGSASFNYASEDLTKYATFNKADLDAALAAIEIEDPDFTTNETVRAQKVLEKIYSTLTDKVVAAGDKVVNGLIGDRDVVYYNYYVTCVIKDSVSGEDINHTVYFESMEEARITNSSYKSSHVIELGKITDDSSDFAKKLAEALSGKTLSASYSTDSTKGASIASGNKVVISYKLDKVDASQNKISSTVNYKVVTLGSDECNGLLKEIIKTDYKNSVGNVATFADGAKTYTTTDGSGNTLTYSNVTVKWKVTSEGEELANFAITQFDKTTKVKDADDNEIDLKGVELTYHVYPVSIIHVPEYSAEAILTYILGSSIKTTSLEIFEDESYTVTGGAKLPELIEELTKIYAATTEKNTTVKSAKEAYDAAKAAVDKVGEKNATTAQKEALEKATKALDDAKKAAAKTAIAEILTATSTAEGAKLIAEAITTEYSESVEHSLTEEYNTAVTEAVAKKVYDAIMSKVSIIDYPATALEEAYNDLYEAYEYSFYNDKHGTSDNAESEYKFYKGDFSAFLAAKTGAKEVDGDIWKGIEAAITKEAKAVLDPVIKIYVVAKAYKDSAKVDLAAWAELDKTAGRFKVEVDRKDYETDAEYNEAVTKAEESETKYYENAKEEADSFLVTDAVFNQYKEEIGKASFDSFVSSYGETNLRTALQFEKLMNYFMSVSTDRVDGENHPHYIDREGDGVLYLDFRRVTYVTVEDTDTDGGENE